MLTLSAGRLVSGGRSIRALLSGLFSRISLRRLSSPQVTDWPEEGLAQGLAVYRLHCMASPYQDLMPDLDRELCFAARRR